MPFYYRRLTGNITDIKTFKNLLKDLDFIKLDKVKLVTDRGFYSESNINALYKEHYKFILAVKVALNIVQQTLEQVRTKMISRPFYSSDHGLYHHSQTVDWVYNEIKKEAMK